MAIRIEDVAVDGPAAPAFVADYACVDCGAPFRTVMPLLPEPGSYDTPESAQRRLAEEQFAYCARDPYRFTDGHCPACGSTAGVGPATAH